MEQFLEEFKLWLSEDRKVSLNTVLSYFADIRNFSAFLKTKRIRSIKRITEALIKDYLGELTIDGRSKATVSRNVASIRSFFSFALQNGYIQQNPATNVYFEKVERKLPSIMTDGEITKLLEAPKGNSFKAVRDKAMFEILYATGIKSSELCELTIKSVNVKNSVIQCRNNKNERELPLYPSALNSVKKYLRLLRRQFPYDKNNPLFVNLSGEKMSRQGFWKIIKKYLKELEMPEDITASTIRNSVAVSMLENGAPTEIIQKIFGYSDITAAQHYVNAAKNKLKTQYSRYHPMGKK